jgi:hypothetical protein
LSTKLVDKLCIGPGFSKGPHVHQVGAEEPRHIRKLPLQVLGQVLNDLGAPALLLLTGENFPPDLPVQQDKFFVDGKCSLHLDPPDTVFEFRQKGVVVIKRQRTLPGQS